MEWRGVTCSDRGRECLRGGDRRRILVFVWPDAVSVLEVDAQILDRLGGQLTQYSLVDLCRDAGLQVQRFGELRLRPAVGIQRLPGLVGPPADRSGVVAVSGHIDRMHRLAAAAVPGVSRREGCVRIGKPCVELVRECVAAVGHSQPRWTRCFRIVETISGQRKNRTLLAILNFRHTKSEDHVMAEAASRSLMSVKARTELRPPGMSIG